MTDCKACEAAEKNPKTGLFQSGCMECDARALAQSPAALEAMTYNHPQNLQGVMRGLWKTKEQYRDGRLAVYRWYSRLNPKE